MFLPHISLSLPLPLPFSLKSINTALAGVAQWIEHRL